MDKEALNLAKVGIIALIDEATGYQESRPPDDLSRIITELSDESEDDEAL